MREGEGRRLEEVFMMIEDDDDAAADDDDAAAADDDECLLFCLLSIPALAVPLMGEGSSIMLLL